MFLSDTIIVVSCHYLVTMLGMTYQLFYYKQADAKRLINGVNSFQSNKKMLRSH